MSKQERDSSFSLLTKIKNGTRFFDSPSFFSFKGRINNERERIKKPEKSPMTPTKRGKESLYRLLIIVAFFLVADVLVLYSLSPLSRIGELSVVGTEEVIVQDVIDASTLHAGESVWRSYIKKSQIETQMTDELPQVKAVKIRFTAPNKFTFDIQEYRTVAYLSINQTYKKILENGIILEEKQAITRGGYPILSEFKEGDVLKRFLVEYEKLEDDLRQNISEIQYSPTPVDVYRIRLFMNDGNQVVASIPTFSERLVYYPTMKTEIGEKQGEFNLEAGAYFTPYESEVEE